MTQIIFLHVYFALSNLIKVRLPLTAKGNEVKFKGVRESELLKSAKEPLEHFKPISYLLSYFRY